MRRDKLKSFTGRFTRLMATAAAAVLLALPGHLFARADEAPQIGGGRPPMPPNALTFPVQVTADYTLYSDGAAVYYDGTTFYADGTVILSDGTIIYADGTIVAPDGTID
jgi:hypothetical protein